MPSYTLAEQRALVLRRLRASDTSRFSSTSGASDYGWIDAAIERGEEEFVRQTKCLRTWAIYELRDGVRTYRLPDGFIDIMAAYFYDSALTDSYEELVVTTIEKLNDEVSDWRVDEGTPERIYIDRQYGTHINFGLYPIPDTNGSAISFSNAYATEVTWICPLYSNTWDYGMVIRYNATPKYVYSTSTSAMIDAEVSNHNLLIEYYRLPYQRTEIPVEAGKAISMFAAAELLSDLPDDSAEFKRSQSLQQQFMGEVATYINRRKRPNSGQELRALPSVWNWQQNMAYYKELP
jgi:hypothetical protein